MEGRVAKRYARALFLQAKAASELGQVSEELRVIAELFANNQAVRDLFLTPIGDYKNKEDAVGKLATLTSETTRDFLKLLIEKKREHLMHDVQREFEALKREAEGVVAALIESAVALTDEQRRAVTDELAKKTGKRIEPTYEVDATLIGGVRVTMGEDTLLDGSVKGRLELLREKLYRDVLLQA